MTDDYLDKVYRLRTDAERRALYDDWAGQYDGDLTAQGYVTPARCAAVVAGSALPKDAPILDMGCGTGLSGRALAAEGFTRIDGADVSTGMMAEARKSGVYARLIDLSGATAPANHYAAVVAAGVIGTGAAPPDVFDQCLDLLSPGGLFCFSFNDHARAVPAYTDRLDAAVTTGKARILAQEMGDHIIGLGSRAMVYLLERQ
ncbi:class I SAM-dependent DNA methyltransferase [Roseicyclus elongatus]|nr:methyltransferase domain-containing protein [Roseibacterium elongatum]